MRFSTSIAFASIVAAALLASSPNEAFTPGTPTPVAPSQFSGGSVTQKDTQANDAMSQYEAALKAAFEQASASAMPSATNQQEELQQDPAVSAPQVSAVPPTAPSAEERIEANNALLEQVQQQEQAIDQYEAALKAALVSSPTSAMENSAAAVAAPSSFSFGQAPAQPQQQQQPAPDLDYLSRDIDARVQQAESQTGGPLDATAKAEIAGNVIVESASAAAQRPQEPDWDGISRDITSQIEQAESKTGGPLDATTKAEIVGTVIAGSAAAAINSPLLLGAALGYAGTHVLGGKRGAALAEATQASFRDAVVYTQAQLQEEEGDLSKASAKIVEHLQTEALSTAKAVTNKVEEQAHQVSREISNVPSHLVQEGKKIVESEDFKEMPKRTFRAVRTFLGSEEVRRARESVVQSIKEGLESEELKAVKSRATQSLNDI